MQGISYILREVFNFQNPTKQM